MARSIAQSRFEAPFDTITIPDPNTVGATVNSSPYSVPKGAVAVTFHVPATAHTFSISALTPGADDQAAETWKLVSGVVGATPTAIAGVAANGIAITFPVVAIGGGVQRLVSSATEAAAPITIYAVWHMLP